MDEKITSRENAKIKYACRLSSSAAFRRSEGRFLAEGRKLCPELARGAELETLFYTETAAEKCPELETLHRQIVVQCCEPTVGGRQRMPADTLRLMIQIQIGRASCRERV